jgi:hypothetical protein
MDTEGLKSLLASARLAADRDVAFSVIRGGRAVERVFDLTRTRSALEFVDATPADLESATG